MCEVCGRQRETHREGEDLGEERKGRTERQREEGDSQTQKGGGRQKRESRGRQTKCGRIKRGGGRGERDKSINLVLVRVPVNMSTYLQ